MHADGRPRFAAKRNGANVHIKTFDSTEQMVEAIRENHRAAMDGLHPSQSALTFGDYWVRFVDLDQSPPLVEFGYVHGRQQVIDLEVAAGASAAEGEEALEETERGLLHDGLMYGIAYSVLNKDGEHGYTHKAHAWPIEHRLFVMAREVDWDVTRLEVVGRMLLTIAFRGLRAHILPKRGDRE